jgi:N-acetylmuramic acid 6-phosphate etherase
MVDMQLSNNKLVKRGTLMLMKELKLDFVQAQKLLLQHGSVRKAMTAYRKK